MKSLLKISFIVIAIFVASCASNKNDDPNSPQPSSDDRDKFVGYWLASENSALVGGTTSHTVNINKSTTNSNEVLINNFYGFSFSFVRASVSNNILTIPYQIFGSNNFAQGSGVLTSPNNISLNYTITVGSSRDSCTAIYTKQ